MTGEPEPPAPATLDAATRHEVNNQLQLVSAQLDIVRIRFRHEPEIVQRMQSAEQALSRALAALNPPPAGSPAATPAPRSLEIVLSEDDALVRMTLASLLTDFGHRVVAVGNGADALAAVSASTELLITDLGLPDIDGAELADAARALRPGLPVVIATGDLREQDGSFVWLLKPLSAAKLRAAIAAALGEA